MTYIDINTVAKTFVDNIFDKITDARHALMRMTFIQADYCYVCDNSNLVTKEIKIDNWMGCNRQGWICCQDCEKYVNVAKKMEEMGMPSLPRSSTHNLTTDNLKFWRKSSRKEIPPYVQTTSHLDDDMGNCIEWRPKYNTICGIITWPQEIDPNQTYLESGPLSNYPWLSKCVPMCNIIYHNRNIFGYDSSCLINKTLQRTEYINNKAWYKTWKDHFDNHYLHANGWLEFYKVCVHKNIPISVINYILEIWGMFQVGNNGNNYK